MIYLFVFNVLLYFFIQVLNVRYISSFFNSETFGKFNPFILIFIFKLPVEIFKVVIGPPLLLEDGVENIYYNIAIFYSTLGLFSEFLLLKFAFFISSKYTIKLGLFNIFPRKNKMIIASFLFYILFFISFYILSSASFGFINWIKDPRTGYQFHRVGLGPFWVFSITFLSISFTLSALYVKKNTSLFILLIFYVYSAFLLGSKGLVLEYLIFFLIVLWLRKYSKIKKVIFYIIPLTFLVMLINFFSNLDSSIEFSSIFSYFDYYVNSAMYYKAYYSGEIDLFYGQIFVSDFWSLLPRGLFPDKPYVYGITHVNEFFFPGAAEATNTPAFGGPVNYFADFGLVGVVVMTFFSPLKLLYYFFLYQLLKKFKVDFIKGNLYVLLLFMFFISPFFLFSLLFPLNIIFFLFLSSLLLFINKFKFYCENNI